MYHTLYSCGDKHDFVLSMYITYDYVRCDVRRTLCFLLKFETQRVEYDNKIEHTHSILLRISYCKYFESTIKKYLINIIYTSQNTCLFKIVFGN